MSMRNQAVKKPRTLQQAIIYFSNPDNCIQLVAKMRWPDGVTCPACGRKDARFLANQKKWQCKSVHHHRQFSVKVGTIFEDSALPLDKWLTAIWMVSNCKNGVSSYEVARALGITQKSAWFMLHRIRLAMQNHSLLKLGGRGKEVEVDESFIGGAARFMHEEKRKRRITETGSKDKTPVIGILERGGQIRAAVIPNCRRAHVEPQIHKNVDKKSTVYTDALLSYNGLRRQGFEHATIDHAEKYVDGRVHTNGLENFWSILKRGLKGTYISVEAFHLFRYLDEQVFRYNFRELPHDGFRFEYVLAHIFGKRLTYSEVTGKPATTPA
ncbi:MAG: IS1595 family transposase [Acidobacteria bacterium]|nr:IS1595 family transposase [Acidobacteriota bacterium]MBI3661812.1 IS1595 family transposase [Acidobacteriota bacterium]